MKVFFAKLSVLTSMLLLYGATSVWAQGKGKISFSGTVQASETEGGGNSKITPLAYAVVSLPEIGVATTTDVKGRFEIQLSNPGKYKVEISSLGYEPLSQTIQLPARDSLKFTLKATSFYLENIVVSAESKKTGAATASKISKSAMEHIQATSLADIMSLLPGASTRTAEEIALKKVSTFSVRNGQSFGTAHHHGRRSPFEQRQHADPVAGVGSPAQGPAYRPPTRASTCEPSPPTTSNR